MKEKIMLLILGLLMYLILTIFTLAVYKLGGLPVNTNVSLKRQILRGFLLITIGWFITLLILVGLFLGLSGVFLLERIIDYPDDNDDDYLKLDYFSK